MCIRSIYILFLVFVAIINIMLSICWLAEWWCASNHCTLCSEKKHPLTFSFISPWV